MPYGKLGKAPTVTDPRTVRLASYNQSIPAPPAEVHRSHGSFGWPLFLNDKLGDCTIAAAAHMREGWQMDSGKYVSKIKDADVQTAYSAVSGYDPATGANDNGAVELDVLKYWRNTGIAGDKIAAFAAVSPRSALQIKQSIWLFGGCYIGLAMPITAQAQTGHGGIWDVPPGGPQGDAAFGSWGGHAVNVVSYDAQRLAVITWGMVQLVTWRFFGTYCDEAYAVLSPDMMDLHGKSPQGLNVAQLQSDLGGL